VLIGAGSRGRPGLLQRTFGCVADRRPRSIAVEGALPALAPMFKGCIAVLRLRLPKLMTAGGADANVPRRIVASRHLAQPSSGLGPPRHLRRC
jgi:hypothetical protein